MATILLFFYSYVNWPSMPRSHLQNSKEFLSGIEASRANLHNYKRIIKLSPFWNKVYLKRNLKPLYLSTFAPRE